MKKRLIAAVLSIVMLLVALPVYASAVDQSWLRDQLIYAYLSGSNTINIYSDLTIDKDTTIPGYIIVYLYSGTLTLEKKLTIEGAFYNIGGTIENEENLIVKGGYFDYTMAPYPPYMYGFPGYPYSYLPWILNPEDWDNFWGGWPIFLPGIPESDTGDISDYYYYLLYLYNQGIIDEDDWDNYYQYLYYYNYYKPVTLTCAEPTANLKSGTTVEFGSTVKLSTTTSDATIYYTTDGSTPDTTANVYTGPIKLNKTEMTIKAIAVKSGYKDSAVATFTYKTKSNISFTDLGTHAETLTPSLVTLVQAKIISDGTTLNPEGSVSYDELISWLKAVGINTAQAVIDETLITDKNALTYEDFAYICYRVLLNASRSVVLPPKKSSDVVLGQLKYGDSVTAKPSIVRAAVMSLVEANLFYKLDFHPKATATRAYAFYMLAEVYNKVN